jgi:hypothetical protein
MFALVIKHNTIDVIKLFENNYSKTYEMWRFSVVVVTVMNICHFNPTAKPFGTCHRTTGEGTHFEPDCITL